MRSGRRLRVSTWAPFVLDTSTHNCVTGPPYHCSPILVLEQQVNLHCMAPRDLPGLYWDDEKKRYFPLASRPAGAPSRPVSRPEANVATVPPRQLSNRRRRSPREGEGSPPRKRPHAQQGIEENGVGPSEARNAWRSLSALRESPLGTFRKRCIQYVLQPRLESRYMTLTECIVTSR